MDISLKIDGTLRGSGFTGCNSWSATLYPVKDQHLAVGPYALTKKQCPKDIMQLELGFLSALLGNPAWDLVNGDLVIKGPRGALRLARSLEALVLDHVAGSGSALTVAGAPSWVSKAIRRL